MDTPDRKEELSAALLSAYRTQQELERMLAFKLGCRLNEIVEPGPLRHVAFQLVEWAEAGGRLEQLVSGAHLHNPGNPLLRKFHDKYFSLVQPQELPAEVERLIVPDNEFQDIAQWRARLEELETRVCQVMVGDCPGTGFLIAPDVVMTNHHVIEPVLQGKLPPTSISLYFDLKRRVDGAAVEPLAHYLLAEDWLLACSPEPAQQQTPAAACADSLDYALLRVDGVPGDAMVGNRPRGFVGIPVAAHEFKPRAPLIIVQHPGGRVMKIAIDTQGVIGVNSTGTRVRYRTNTQPGSSGAPCFNLRLELVALHRAGARDYNEGVPISVIRAHMEGSGLRHLLGGSRAQGTPGGSGQDPGAAVASRSKRRSRRSVAEPESPPRAAGARGSPGVAGGLDLGQAAALCTILLVLAAFVSVLIAAMRPWRLLWGGESTRQVNVSTQGDQSPGLVNNEGTIIIGTPPADVGQGGTGAFPRREK